MRRLDLGIWLILIFGLFLINGCTHNQNVTDQARKDIVCNSPYIRVGINCCLDQNNNNICDNDEATSNTVTDIIYGNTAALLMCSQLNYQITDLKCIDNKISSLTIINNGQIDIYDISFEIKTQSGGGAIIENQPISKSSSVKFSFGDEDMWMVRNNLGIQEITAIARIQPPSGGIYRCTGTVVKRYNPCSK